MSPPFKKRGIKESALLVFFALLFFSISTNSEQQVLTFWMPDSLLGFVDSCGSSQPLGSSDSPQSQSHCVTALTEISTQIIAHFTPSTRKTCSANANLKLRDYNQKPPSVCCNTLQRCVEERSAGNRMMKTFCSTVAPDRSPDLQLCTNLFTELSAFYIMYHKQSLAHKLVTTQLIPSCYQPF